MDWSRLLRFKHACVVFLTLLFLASQAHLVWMLAPLHPSVFSLQLAFSAADFWQVVHAWGAEGLARYRAHFAFDSVHPFIYGSFGYAVASLTPLFEGWSPRQRRLMRQALPSAAGFDLLENAAHGYLLGLPAGAGGGLVPLAATSSALKWGIAATFALLLAWQIARHFGARLRPSV